MATNRLPEYRDILDFWFFSENKHLWFKKNDYFDLLIRKRFYPIWISACHGELFSWRRNAGGRLAEIIILDQFSRNLNRGSGKAYSQDGMALILSQELVSSNIWDDLNSEEKAISLLPWMHSESLVIHEKAKELYKRIPLAGFYEYELKHSEIFEAFGRYPHRNAVLNRDATQGDLTWMKNNLGF